MLVNKSCVPTCWRGQNESRNHAGAKELGEWGDHFPVIGFRKPPVVTYFNVGAIADPPTSSSVNKVPSLQ
uniref:Uncharacterized protein n=1 Tax=Fagus sylvatica TaxID=28930 RepID=A0A2N9FQF6_FAGSY